MTFCKFFVQVKCWQVRRQIPASEVAHTISIGFTSVEVMKVKDLHELGTEVAVKVILFPIMTQL